MGTINLDAKLRKAGIAALKISQYNCSTPLMPSVLQILIVTGIRVDDQ